MKRSIGVGLGVVAIVAGVVVYLLVGRGGGGSSGGGGGAITTTDEHGPKAPVARGRSGEGRDFGGPSSNDALIDDDPKGALRLEGQVVGDNDQPVADATVVLSSNPPRTTATEKDGSFAFDALVGRPYTLIARGGGGIAGPITARLTATTGPVILHLRPASTVNVAVVDEKGEPIANAAVELRGLDEQATTAGPDGKGKFAPVVPGGYDVVAHAPGYASGNEPVRVAGESIDVKVVLGRGGPVSGVVLDDRGGPVANARVVFSGASDWSRQGDERKDAAISDKDGAFKFEAIPAGTFRFVAHHAERAPGTSALVTLDGATARDHVEIRMPPGATVRGTVVDGTGAPVPSARVRIGAAGAGMVSDGPRQAFSDDRGEFVVPGLPRKPLAAVALSDDAASATVPVDTSAGDVDKVVLKLDVTGTIAGIVVDDGGQPLEGVQVSAFPDFRAQRKAGSGDSEMSAWRLRGFPQDLTDGAGGFTLVGLAPGSYRVRATRSRAASRGRGFAGEGTSAEPGTKDLRIVLPPEGSVKGKVTYADGTSVGLFTVGVGFTEEPVSSKDGSFVLDGLAPDHYTLAVKGGGFVSKSVELDVKGGAATDAGTIIVQQGRSIRGTVVANGQGVPGATVWAGRQIFGNGSSNDARFGGGGPPMAQGTRKTTTGEDGSWSLSGFGLSDVTIVAEEPTLGRSAALRLQDGDPNEKNLVLTLAPFGALKGVLKQGAAPAEGVIVSAQSVSSPGAFYSVATGPDGAYRFDKLAPDSYKVSATLGMPMRGMKFYSKTVTVVSGQDTVVDLTYTPGAVSLSVTCAATGKIGAVNAWILSGVTAAKSGRELQLKIAAQGAGSSQWNIVPMGGATTFTELTAGTYTACMMPFPAEVSPMASRDYAMKYSDVMAVFCKTVNVAASPTEQSVAVPIEVPPMIKDDSGTTPPPGRPRGGAGGPPPGAP
jgi:protocatechuate 3,4-dioxygenase beta subunit